MRKLPHTTGRLATSSGDSSEPPVSTAGCELSDFGGRQPVDDPFLHLARAERSVEAERGLVPVENRPLHAAAVARLRDARELAQERAPDAVGALRGSHEQIFEVQA